MPGYCLETKTTDQMIIAGAGGHALECFDILVKDTLPILLEFFDDVTKETLVHQKYSIIRDDAQIESHFAKDPRFILAVGDPKLRIMFYEKFTRARGEMVNLRGTNTTLSSFANYSEVDIFSHCFVGPKAVIGRGTLVNTGALVHHEVQIGDFCEISPKAVLLGAVKIGYQTRIGANATILPKVRVGNRVVIGAGAVITKDVPDDVTVVGVPGRIIKKS